MPVQFRCIGTLDCAVYIAGANNHVLSGAYAGLSRFVSAADVRFKIQKWGCNMQDFGEHGREFISPETALRLLRLLADEGALARFCEAQGLDAQRLQHALRDVIFKVRSQRAAN